MTTSTELVPVRRVENGDLDRSMSMPALTLANAIERRDAMVQFVQTIMRRDTDYGVVPGTDKPTLLKPGAEKLTTFFGLTSRFQIVEKEEDWAGERHGGEPLFYYLYRCSLSRGDHLIAEADGSCNSRESKYRWRWVKESDLPTGVNKDRLQRRASSAREPEFALKKKETGGKYGKPAAYWEKFERAIADGTARRVEMETKGGKRMMAWEIGDTAYRVTNDDVASQLNTIQKMAQKRALVGCTLLAVNASEFFTQDVEDMDLIGDGQPFTTPPPAGTNTDTGEFTDDAPDLSKDADFLTVWGNICEGKGLGHDEGRWALGALCNKTRVKFSQADVPARQRLVAACRGWDAAQVEQIRQKYAESHKPAPDESQAPAPGNGAGSAADPGSGAEGPDVSGADAEPPDVDPVAEALSQDWDDARDYLVDIGERTGASRADVSKAIDAYAKLNSPKGDVTRLSLPKRREAFDALKSGRMNLSGQITQG